jgi:hypothetical protein
MVLDAGCITIPVNDRENDVKVMNRAAIIAKKRRLI